jgi:hypothetical protein
MPQMRGFATLRHYIPMGHQQEMEMLGHDDIIHHLKHRIIPLDALPQLLFHHLPQR